MKCISASCAIRLVDKVVITGGTETDGYGDPLSRVTSYNHNGFLADLPELQESRLSHGCTHFSNNDNKLVRFFITSQVSQ